MNKSIYKVIWVVVWGSILFMDVRSDLRNRSWKRELQGQKERQELILSVLAKCKAYDDSCKHFLIAAHTSTIPSERLRYLDSAELYNKQAEAMLRMAKNLQ